MGLALSFIMAMLWMRNATKRKSLISSHEGLETWTKTKTTHRNPPIKRMDSSLSTSWIVVALLVHVSFGFTIPFHNGSTRLIMSESSRRTLARPTTAISSSVDDQANEAIKSLEHFHVGQWAGRAVSFAVTNDVAAGVVRRNVSRDYTSTMEASSKGLFQETIGFDDVSRSVDIDFQTSQMDVDAVDASYSLDHHAKAIVELLPPETLDAVPSVGFCVEHCLVTGDNQRVRCFVVYDEDHQLARIIVSNEDRVSGQPTTLSKSNNKERQWQSTMISSTTDENKALEPSTANLLELTSGAWLGDAIIRDNLSVIMSPMEKKGFGDTKFSSIPFASWSIGVQKIAWRWLWDFEEEIRQVVDLGKVLGTEMIGTDQFNLMGSVVANESMSRRIAKEERIVFIDWERDSVSFLVGAVAIQVRLVLVVSSQRRLNVLYRSLGNQSLIIPNESAHSTPICACFKLQKTVLNVSVLN